MNPIRAIRMRLMPPCSKCAHTFIGITKGWFCEREQCREYFERLDCLQRKMIERVSVRGMACCKFEERKDDGSGAD